MTHTILNLGMPRDTAAALAANVPASILEAESIEEACRLVQELEITCIVFDERVFPVDIDMIEQLLGRTPLTTRIVLLSNRAGDGERHRLSSLGVRTFPPSMAVEELARELAH